VNRSVLVTGGSRGIGAAIARALADSGADVAVTYRTGTPPDGLFGTHCDVTDPASVDDAFTAVEAEQGPVEVLVANAGITRDGLLLGMANDDFTAVLQTNLVGAYYAAKRAASGMVRRRWGRLVFLSSAVGFLGAPGQANYTASKTGLLGLTRSLAWELGSRNITANLVAPGLIDTDMTKPLTDKRREALLGMTALGRAGTADEVAAAVRFLASDEAGYVTGGVLPVAGGLGMGH
jgi:3-oxoacyl-[acyl-carrier protein] reductase